MCRTHTEICYVSTCRAQRRWAGDDPLKEAASPIAASAQAPADPPCDRGSALKWRGSAPVALAWLTGRAMGQVAHYRKRLRSVGLVASRRNGKLALYDVTSRSGALIEAVTIRR